MTSVQAESIEPQIDATAPATPGTESLNRAQRRAQSRLAKRKPKAKPKGKRKRKAPEPSFAQLTNDSFIREAGLIPWVFPWNPCTLWDLVAKGEFPAPIKLSARTTAWRVGDVRSWIAERTRLTRKASAPVAATV